MTPAFYPSLERHDAASRTDSLAQITDEQWQLIEDLFDWEPPSRLGGRPPIPPRAVLDALLWMLKSGVPWKNLPDTFASESTCRRRLKEWTESGLLCEVWARLVDLADEFGQVDWEHFIADGTFCPAKKGENWLTEDSREKVRLS